MTEVPEHLLKRSKDRRSSLSGEAPSSDAPAASAAEPGNAVEATAPTAAAKVAAATPAVAAEPEFVPPYVEAALKRKKIPVWVVPVLAFMPVWVFIYIGGLSPASDGRPTQLAEGQAIYSAQCAGCHGAGGGGGVGRPMNEGNLIKTFPDILSQLEFVWIGSNGLGPAGTPYGDPNREGGQHKTLDYNGNPMPAFDESLTQAELLAVVRYEREVLSATPARSSTPRVCSSPPMGSRCSTTTASSPSSRTGPCPSAAPDRCVPNATAHLRARTPLRRGPSAFWRTRLEGQCCSDTCAAAAYTASAMASRVRSSWASPGNMTS